jgi:hypothetical protein
MGHDTDPGQRTGGGMYLEQSLSKDNGQIRRIVVRQLSQQTDC